MLPLLSNDATIPKSSEKYYNIDWYELINLFSKKMSPENEVGTS